MSAASVRTAGVMVSRADTLPHWWLPFPFVRGATTCRVHLLSPFKLGAFFVVQVTRR